MAARTADANSTQNNNNLPPNARYARSKLGRLLAIDANDRLTLTPVIDRLPQARPLLALATAHAR